MIRHAVRINKGDVASAALGDLREVGVLLNWLPDREPEWTCHGLCRYVAKSGFLNLPWIVRDGHYGKFMRNHSWLELRDPKLELILDVYPIAALSGPALFDFHGVAELYVAPRYSDEQLEGFLKESIDAWAALLAPGKTK